MVRRPRDNVNEGEEIPAVRRPRDNVHEDDGSPAVRRPRENVHEAPEWDIEPALRF